jgi:hypothetical protein
LQPARVRAAIVTAKLLRIITAPLADFTRSASQMFRELRLQ